MYSPIIPVAPKTANSIMGDLGVGNFSSYGKNSNKVDANVNSFDSVMGDMNVNNIKPIARVEASSNFTDIDTDESMTNISPDADVYSNATGEEESSNYNAEMIFQCNQNFPLPRLKAAKKAAYKKCLDDHEEAYKLKRVAKNAEKAASSDSLTTEAIDVLTDAKKASTGNIDVNTGVAAGTGNKISIPILIGGSVLGLIIVGTLGYFLLRTPTPKIPAAA